MAEYIARASLPKKKDYWDDDFGAGYDQCLEDIARIPAADVRPVRRGKWTDHRTNEHDGEWYCSACGKEITIYMGPDRDDRYSYCPNCGADMRGGENDG